VSIIKFRVFIIKISFIFIVFLISLTNCYGKEEIYQNYISEKGYFSAYFPKLWFVGKGRNPNVIVKAHNGTGAGINIVYKNDMNYEKSVKDIITTKEMASSYIDMGWGVKLLDSGETTFWNEDALYIKIMCEIKHLGATAHIILWQMQFTHRNDLYVITFSAGSDNEKNTISQFNQFENHFAKVLTTFQLDDWKRIK